MTVSRGAAAGGLSLALLLGLLLGRHLAPSRVVERDLIATSDRDTSLTWRAYVGHTTTTANYRRDVVWKITTRWLPGGAVEQHAESSSREASATSSSTSAAEHAGRLEEKIAEKLVYREKLVEAKKPDWIFGLGAGERLDKWELVYQAGVARRILGPVFLEGWAQAIGPSRDGTAVGLRVLVLY